MAEKIKKVLLHGYPHLNLGDDLFFRVIADRYPDVRFYFPMLSTDYRGFRDDSPNLISRDFCGISKLTSHKTYALPKIYSRLNMRSFDAVVCIGGSLFIDQKNPPAYHKKEIEKYSFICDWEIAQKAGVPYFVLGANWGPCYNQYFFDNFNRAFGSLTDLYFRDTASYNVFADKPAARHGSDILLGAPYVRKYADGVQKKKQVTISVLDAQYKNSDADAAAYDRKMAEFCTALPERGYDVVLASFCAAEGDEKAVKRILALCPDTSRVRTLCYRGDHAEMLRTMAESELVIASRFHATILAWTLGTPAFSVVYSDKTANVLDDCGLSASMIRLADVASLDIDTVFRSASLADTDRFCGTETAFARLDEVLSPSDP